MTSPARPCPESTAWGPCHFDVVAVLMGHGNCKPLPSDVAKSQFATRTFPSLDIRGQGDVRMFIRVWNDALSRIPELARLIGADWGIRAAPERDFDESPGIFGSSGLAGCERRVCVRTCYCNRASRLKIRFEVERLDASKAGTNRRRLDTEAIGRPSAFPVLYRTVKGTL